MHLPSFASHDTPTPRPRHASAPARRFAFFGSGHAVGYADPKTLLPGPEKCKPTGGREGAAERSPAVESAGSGEGLLLGSLEEFQPTLMAGVPKVCGGGGADTGDRLALFSDSSRTLLPDLCCRCGRRSRPALSRRLGKAGRTAVLL